MKYQDRPSILQLYCNSRDTVHAPVIHLQNTQLMEMNGNMSTIIHKQYIQTVSGEHLKLWKMGYSKCIISISL